jgi:hypothetical protein
MLDTPTSCRHVMSTASRPPRRAKAFLTFHDVTFRKTHDLNELGGQCAALNPSLALCSRRLPI